MTRSWIRILADKQDANLVIRCCGQGVENVGASRKNRLPTGKFLVKKGIERVIVRLARFLFEQGSPTGRNRREHGRN